MKKERLYKDLAKYYDRLYVMKDYKKETEYVRKLIQKYKQSRGKDLLEVACGTGSHLLYLQKQFRCVGIDINKEMLAIARKKLKKIPFKKADMISFNLNKKFDIILCLFSSIGYVKSEKNLKKTLNSLNRHLKKGGLIIIEPWLTPKSFGPGKPHLTLFDENEIKIVRVTTSTVKGIISLVDMHYLIAEKGKKVKHYEEQHELALFNKKTILKNFKEAGLQPIFLKKGLSKDRGLYIALKP